MLKKSVSKAAADGSTGGVAPRYVEDAFEVTCLREAASAKAGNDAGGLFQHPAHLPLQSVIKIGYVTPHAD
jgi:hypothetical protein